MAGVLVTAIAALAVSLAVVVAVLAVLVRGQRARLAALEARLARREAAAPPIPASPSAASPSAASPSAASPSPSAAPDAAPAGYLITRIGEPEPPATTTEQVPARVDATLFADLLVRETAVQAVALAHGVRRALAPETRHRIRFHVRQEVKRARKQRRAEMRLAHREWAARQRLAAAQEPAPRAARDTQDSAA